MKIGIITSGYNYISLNEFAKNAVKFLGRHYNIEHLRTKDNTNSAQIQNLYRRCDVVVNLSSRIIRYDRRINKPTVIFAHAWMDHGAGINFYLYGKNFYSRDVIVFASRGSLDKFHKVYKTKLMTYVAPYFIDKSKFFIPKHCEDRKILDKYNIPIDKDILIYAGRFSEEKNIEGLIRLFNQINSKKCCLVLLGGFKNYKTYGFGYKNSEVYKKRVLNLLGKKKNNQVIVIENIKRTDLIKILSLSKLFITTTLCFEENFGLAVVEAMSLGVPVVCSSWGGLKEIVEHNKTGFLMKTTLDSTFVPKIGYSPAIKFINSLLDDEKKYRIISLNAKKRAEKFFTEGAFMDKMEVIIKNLKNGESGSNKELIRPREYFSKIYQRSLRLNRVDRIYLDNPKLFKILYSYYSSKNKMI